MNVLVSIPDHSRPKEIIMRDFSEASKAIKKIFSSDDDLYIQPDYHDCVESDVVKGALHYLGEAIRLLDGAEAVYFCSGWEGSKRCKATHYICELYGIQRFEM